MLCTQAEETETNQSKVKTTIVFLLCYKGKYIAQRRNCLTVLGKNMLGQVKMHRLN